jgi:cytidylate kinase
MSHAAPVRVITISREFGAGATGLGARLAQALGWKLWDKDVLRGVSEVLGNPVPELAQIDEREAEATLRHRLHSRPAHRAHLAALREWMEMIAEQGKAIVIGRGAAVLLRYRAGVFHLRLVAPLAQRADRARQLDPSLDQAAAEAKCRQMDRDRARYVKYFFGEDVANLTAYHATINTGRFDLDATARLLAGLVGRRVEEAAHAGGAVQGPGDQDPSRIITLTSQLGSRERDLGRELAKRLGMKFWDREALAQAAGVADVFDADLIEMDRQGFEAMGKVMTDLGRRGNAILLGWGGSQFFKSCPSALRAKLVAPVSERLRRVIEARWVDEKAARAAIAESDVRRKEYYRRYFGVDWDDPLQFDMVVNTASLGPRAADLVIQAAHLKWHAQPGG